ncbi:MAG TPA: site-2 protease family protein [Chthoniobacteraceae bacterium]|nr:site-2 protease family protein [Chthoniobacteraceae bacterium]
MKMFFIPFFGAAVTGKPTASGAARAVMILLGPVPGIVLGTVAAVFAVSGRNPLLLRYAMVSIGLNLFNLIPVPPLDGGRFFEAVLFSRSILLELCFRLFAVVALALLAWRLSSLLFGALALFSILACREMYMVGKIARRYRKAFPGEPAPSGQQIPHETLERLLPDLDMGLPGGASLKPRSLAFRARNAWDRLTLKPPGIVFSIAMLACYAAAIIVALVGSVYCVLPYYKFTVVDRTGADGRPVRVQETYFGKYKLQEAQLAANGLFDGPSISWDTSGRKTVEGDYKQGFRDGQWTFYDAHGGTKAIAQYESQKLVSYQEYRDIGVVDVPPDQWPADVVRAGTVWHYSQVGEQHDFK